MTADGEQALLCSVQARYRRRGARIRGQARETFLPQVWDTLREPPSFSPS
jgi:hypothetical protein